MSSRSPGAKNLKRLIGWELLLASWLASVSCEVGDSFSVETNESETVEQLTAWWPCSNPSRHRHFLMRVDFSGPCRCPQSPLSPGPVLQLGVLVVQFPRHTTEGTLGPSLSGSPHRPLPPQGLVFLT